MIKPFKIRPNDRGKVITLKRDILVYKSLSCNAICQLLIPKGAKIVVPYNYTRKDSLHKRKLRCSSAIVTAIIPRTSHPNYYIGRVEYFYSDIKNVNTIFNSKYTFNFKYKIGSIVTPTKGLDKNTTTPCKSGIHFFLTLQDAEKY